MKLSKEYSNYYIRLTVGYLGGIEVRIKNTNSEKVIFDDSSYTFEHLFEAYKEAKKELLEVPELKKLIERS